MTAPLKINFIGCGRLGQTLAYLWQKNNIATIQSIFTRSIVHSQTAIDFIGAGTACDRLSALQPADVYCFACNDDVTAYLCEALLAVHTPAKQSIFLHFSGTHTSSLLQSAKPHDIHIASIHPMHSFATPNVSIHHFSGTLCAFEGNNDCKDTIEILFTAIGAHIYAINADMKTLYHAAGVFACNFLPLLTQCAYTCLQKSAVPETFIKLIIQQLMQNMLNNIKQLENISAALTGPLSRGDVQVIEQHVQQLAQHTDYAPLYRLLSAFTLPLTQLDETTKQHLKAVLE